MMMDILMYLFETYIHSDADLQVDQESWKMSCFVQVSNKKTSTKPLSG